MKNNKIFLVNNFTEYDILLLKKDFFNLFLDEVLKIKNLNIELNEIKELADFTIENVFKTYDFASDKSLHSTIKEALYENLKYLYRSKYPFVSPSKVKWPKIASGHINMTQRQLAINRIKLMQSLNKDKIEIVKKILSPKQKELFLFVLTIPCDTPYKRIASKLKMCIASVSNNLIKISEIINKK